MFKIPPAGEIRASCHLITSAYVDHWQPCHLPRVPVLLPGCPLTGLPRGLLGLQVSFRDLQPFILPSAEISPLCRISSQRYKPRVLHVKRSPWQGSCALQYTLGIIFFRHLLKTSGCKKQVAVISLHIYVCVLIAFLDFNPIWQKCPRYDAFINTHKMNSSAFLQTGT